MFKMMFSAIAGFLIVGTIFFLSLAYLDNLSQAGPMQAMPIPKDGQCPGGYSTQGNMCVPNANATPAIPKSGSCPSDWFTHGGNYCVANSANPKNVIPRNGLCPGRYSIQGNYCVQN